MLLNNNIKEKIRNHALSKPKEEVCGFICFNKISLEKEIFCCNNSNGSRNNAFTINPLDYVRASRSGEILAVYHSHVNDNLNFSLSDKINSNSHEVPFILYNVRQNIFNEYFPNDYEFSYIGREFEYGKFDCFSLVKDYYKKELGINIIDNYTNRNDNWYEKKSNSFLEGWKNDNSDFNIVEKPKKHDVLFLKYFKTAVFPHHMGIYLGEDMFLHHPRNKYSLIEKYSDTYKRKTFSILRHKSL